jgi:hypothetical protein
VAVTVVWSATSSALRAPPLALIGRHVPGPSQPWAAGLFMLGMGVAGAVSPYLAVALKGADPRLPFALAAVALAAATVVMTRAIRANPDPAAPQPGRADPLTGQPVAMFLFAVTLLGLGFQHFVLTPRRVSAPRNRKTSVPDARVLIGFNSILPASLRRSATAAG